MRSKVVADGNALLRFYLLHSVLPYFFLWLNPIRVLTQLIRMAFY